jgi:hypothetical protein
MTNGGSSVRQFLLVIFSVIEFLATNYCNWDEFFVNSLVLKLLRIVFVIVFYFDMQDN